MNAFEKYEAMERDDCRIALLQIRKGINDTLTPDQRTKTLYCLWDDAPDMFKAENLKGWFISDRKDLIFQLPVKRHQIMGFILFYAPNSPGHKLALSEHAEEQESK